MELLDYKLCLLVNIYSGDLGILGWRLCLSSEKLRHYLVQFECSLVVIPNLLILLIIDNLLRCPHIEHLRQLLNLLTTQVEFTFLLLE